MKKATILIFLLIIMPLAPLHLQGGNLPEVATIDQPQDFQVQGFGWENVFSVFKDKNIERIENPEQSGLKQSQRVDQMKKNSEPLWTDGFTYIDKSLASGISMTGVHGGRFDADNAVNRIYIAVTEREFQTGKNRDAYEINRGPQRV